MKIVLSDKRIAARHRFIDTLVARVRSEGAVRIGPLKKGSFNMTPEQLISAMRFHGLSVEGFTKITDYYENPFVVAKSIQNKGVLS